MIKKTTLALLLATVSLSPVTMAETINDIMIEAKRYYDNEDYRTAIHWLEKAASKGDATAMSSIGYMYDEGQGVTQDYRTAMDWYKKAATKGDISAMSNIGYMYEIGQGVTQDYRTAMDWYEKAAAKGDASAMNIIGYMYNKGQGVTQDYRTAMDWYGKAAAKGDASAMGNIGYMYESGQGVTQDYRTAMDWYEKAAVKGDSSAMNSIGYMYESGQGVTQDYRTAMDWYEKAAAKGDSSAMKNIGLTYLNNESVLQDYLTALDWFNKAGDTGRSYKVPLMYIIGLIYHIGEGSPKDLDKAAEWYLNAYEEIKVSQKDYSYTQSIKERLESFLANDKITKPALRKRIEGIFDKSPLIAWNTQPLSTTSSETLTLSVTLTDQGGGIGDVRLLLNGVAIDQSSRGLSRTVNQTTRDFTLSIPEGKHTVTVEVYPAENIGITNKVTQQITSTYASKQKPKLHAVVIGIDQYNNPDLKLNYATKDASAIYDVLNKQIGSIYDKGNISLLNTASTTSKDNIISKINQIKQTAKMNDVFVFYVAAHGYNYPDTGYHLFTSDVGATSSRQVTKTGINADDLQGMLAQVNTNKKLILLDTCDSGGSIDAGQLLISRGLDDQDVIDTMQRKSGAAVIMASTDKQKALEGYQGHGVFTYGLLQAFNGAGDMNKDGYMKTGELSNYIEDEIPSIAQRAFSQPQYPTSSMIGNGFEFKVF